MKFFIAFITLMFSLTAAAQNAADTTTILYNSIWNEISTGVPAYVGLVWTEKNKWHKQDYYYPQSTLQMDGVFADKELKVKDGLFTWFHQNGMMRDSCLFTTNQREGTQVTWDNEGNQTSMQQWHKNLPVDTAIWWQKDGASTAVQITDSMGNGIYQSYLDDGKTIKIKGRLAAGKRTGKWTFKDANGFKGIDAEYLADSVLNVTCYDEKGELQAGAGDCKVEKAAAFRGGNDGWRSYLERRLNYPAAAVANQIEGVVKIQFNIQKDGSVSDITVLESPDESLSAEAGRLIRQSPKWEPAIQFNRPVIYRHIQAITFALR